MALRDQPYLPLYVQDVLTDEKLAMCSAEAHGVYFKLICILHKQEEYGKICLKQKYKQTESKFDNFAIVLAKQMPFDPKQISNCLVELHEESVIHVSDEYLYQKRMVKDGGISEMRSANGKKGGSNLTKQYGRKGYLYLMSDGFEKTKIGVSITPGTRLYRVRSVFKLPKYFELKYEVPVDDMGKSEDIAQEFFRDILDGEWLIGDFKDIDKRFALLEAKLKAKSKAKHETNTEYEYEYENSINSSSSLNNKDAEKEKNWKTDFSIYLAELKFEYLKALSDTQWVEERQKFNPGVNIQLTLEKACTEFWATEAGWKNKKASGSKTIDWKRTLANAVSLKSNRVYGGEQKPIQKSGVDLSQYDIPNEYMFGLTREELTEMCINGKFKKK